MCRSPFLVLPVVFCILLARRPFPRPSLQPVVGSAKIRAFFRLFREFRRNCPLPIVASVDTTHHNPSCWRTISTHLEFVSNRPPAYILSIVRPRMSCVGHAVSIGPQLASVFCRVDAQQFFRAKPVRCITGFRRVTKSVSELIGEDI